ncbi:MAG: hypothetical protein K8H86_15765 [Ignavibacteriaceae bacterium]|nr:hypothetical protein [Ignavibacteriaceae bacterium]
MKTRIILIATLLLFAVISILPQNGRARQMGERWDKDEVVKVTGTLKSVSHPVAIVNGNDGKEYELRMGPVWFWKNNDYKLQPGEKIEISGEIENDNGKYYLYPYVINQNGKEIKLADEDGVPVWSRGGRGNSRNYDNRGYGRGGNRGGRCRW